MLLGFPMKEKEGALLARVRRIFPIEFMFMS